MPKQFLPRPVQTALLTLGVAGAYFAAARLGLAFAFVEQKVTLVWPPTGVALAAVLIFGYRAVPGIVVGAFVANVSTGSPFLFCLATAVGNPLEAVAGAWMLRRQPGFDRALGRIRDVVAFVLAAGVVSPPLAATLGVFGLCISGSIPWRAFGSVWPGWCLGDAMGVLLFAPALMAWTTDRAETLWRARRGEFLGLLALLTGAAAAVFLTVLPQRLYYLQRPYFLLPLLLWAVVRIGPGGAAVAVAVTSAIALAGTALGTGPFTGQSMHENLGLLLAFMSMISVVSLTLGAVLAERDAAQQRVAQANAELERRVRERTRELEEQRQGALELAREAGEARRIVQEAQEALREVTTVQQAILDGTNYAIISTDPTGLVTTFNRGAENMLGYAAGEIVGRTTPALWHDAEEVARRAVVLTGQLGRRVEPGFEAFVAKTRQGSADENEWTFVRKDGSRLPVSLSVTALRDSNEKITGFLGVVADITERRRAEQALQVSEARFRSALVYSPIGIALVGLDGRWFMVNAALCNIVGYSEAELLATDFQSITHLDDLRTDLEQVEKLLRGEQESYEIEKRYRHKNAQDVRVQLNVSLVRDKAGNPLYFISQIQDITARKKAEAEKNRLLSIIEECPDFIGTADMQGRLLYHNQAARRLVGLPPDANLSQMKIGDMHPAWAARLVLEKGIPAVLERGSWHSQNALRHRDGHEIPVLQVLMLHRNEAGEPEFFSTLMRDITALKQAEAEKRASEERFRIMVDGVTDYAILRLDTEGRVVSWNTGAERINGYSAPEILGRHFSVFYPAEALEKNRPQEILRLATTQGKYEEEGWHVRKDGARFWAGVIITAIRDADGQLQGFSKVARDLTERKQAEDALKAALAEKEILLREIHHRVKNNMQVISSILNLQAGYIDDARMRALFVDCQGRVQTMAMIHEKLYRSPNLDTLDFGAHVRELAGMLVRSFGEVSGRVRLIAEADPVSLDIDTAIPVGLILNELITNALKYAFPEGRSGNLRVRLRLEQPGRLMLSVLDDGVGLPDGFEIDQAQSLGLKMVRSLTRQINGRLELHQERGIEFRISFPAPAKRTEAFKSP